MAAQGDEVLLYWRCGFDRFGSVRASGIFFGILLVVAFPAVGRADGDLAEPPEILYPFDDRRRDGALAR
jgi:hypothetical protein